MNSQPEPVFRRIFGLFLAVVFATPVLPGAETFDVGIATTDDLGCLVHTVRSSDQAATTQIRVLLPPRREAEVRYPVVYVLPVEANREHRYGDGLREIVDQGLHRKYAAIFVAPTFSSLPWYADHPTNPALQQESYFISKVVPFVEKNYPAIDGRAGRMLLGFSKSGWGAWSLILRHPDLFQKAAAWDAPLQMDWPGKYGSIDIFLTEQNFKGYQIKRLLADKAGQFQDSPRLIHLGYGNFQAEHRATQELIGQLKIKAIYRDGPSRKHDWHSGWVAEALELLLAQDKK